MEEHNEEYQQLKKIAEKLGGEVRHYTCCDRTTEHQKFVIEYGHQQKNK